MIGECVKLELNMKLRADGELIFSETMIRPGWVYEGCSEFYSDRRKEDESG